MKEKICSKCKVSKSVDNFTKHKGRKDGLCGWCISCVKNARKIYYEKNKDKIIKQHKDDRIKNIEEYKERDRSRYLKNQDKNKTYSLNYYYKNREKLIEKNREYKKQHSERLKEQKKKYDFEHQKEKRKRKKERLHSDIQFRIKENLRSRISKAIRKTSAFKFYNSQELIGCSIDDLRTYLESLFTDGMTWENYGFRGWHIDHIIPCFMFDLTLEESQKKCFHYTNLRPLWWYENVSRDYKELKDT